MLTVLYDSSCALCRKARSWLQDQPKYVEMEFVPADSLDAHRLFPDLDHASTLQDLTVVGSGGELYRGAKAWVMCLWALREYRETALKLSTPETMPMARRLIAWVSRNRLWLSSAMENVGLQRRTS